LLNKVWIASWVVTFIISQFKSLLSHHLLLGSQWCMLYLFSLFILALICWNNFPHSSISK
jgi:hypothetical protein